MKKTVLTVVLMLLAASPAFPQGGTASPSGAKALPGPCNPSTPSGKTALVNLAGTTVCFIAESNRLTVTSADGNPTAVPISGGTVDENELFSAMKTAGFSDEILFSQFKTLSGILKAELGISLR